MGQVYYDMGFLSSTEVVECSASDLVAHYVGQTGHKTRQVFERALGKVLFIDEAYRLSEGHFAKEAMDELVGILTQDAFAGKLIVILAGYDQEMNQLMAVNPGLSSRFPETITFENMSPEQCLDILRNTLKKSGIRCRTLDAPSSEDYQRLVALFRQLASLPSWGNARDVITLSKQMVRIVYKRTSTLPDELTLEGQDAVDCVAEMLQERYSRAANLPRASMHTGPPLPFQHLGPPPPAPPSISTASSQATSVAPPPPPEVPPETPSDVGDSERDVGVSDSVWAQLQADKQAALDAARRQQEALEEAERAEAEARRAEEEARALRVALEERARQQAADDELKRRLEAQRLREIKARAELEKRRLELEARKQREMEERKREQQAQRKLRTMGICPAGFQWVKQSGGYRCTAGGHYVSDSQLGM